MFGLGVTELLIIFMIVFLIFSVNKLPQIGDGLGKASAALDGVFQKPPK